MSSNFIVTTTINAPTKALRRFASMNDWTLIVVADQATPVEQYRSLDCVLYSVAEQERDYPLLSRMLGWQTIQRRNVGFLKALSLGADIVATVDDDNIPTKTWGENLVVGQEISATSYLASEVFDPVSVTNYPSLWHRGFPIQLLKQRDTESQLERFFVDVEASFWNGDPDVDAICRMEHAPNCLFDDDDFPFTSRQPSPFNSQNTFLTRKALSEYFVFPFVGRMDDIWAAYYLQILGYRVCYSRPSVTQERNEHDLSRDFDLEILGYQKTLEFIRSIQSSKSSLKNYIGERSFDAYQEYLKLASSYD